MTLVRVWRRQLMGGMSAAVVVPAALVVSLAALGLAGGFGGLTALGQALSGPSAPAQPLVTAHGRAVGAVPAALATALSAPPAGPATSSSIQPATAGGGPISGSPGSGPSGTPRGGTTGSGPGPAGRPQPPASGGSGGSGGGSPAPKPGPQPQPTLEDRVVSAGTSVTSQVPGPAGEAATKALQTAGSTLDSIAPLKSP
jgi:hypothetical protein